VKLEQSTWTSSAGWNGSTRSLSGAQLVLVFGGTGVVAAGQWRDELHAAYPNAHFFGCSTAGEIAGIRVYEDSLVATAVELERTNIHLAQTTITGLADSHDAGARLAAELPSEGLRHVLVISDGQHVNGSELVRGLCHHIPAGVNITGGLAGDGPRFERTLVFGDNEPREKTIAALGLYGESLRVGWGSLGGWDPFGPERVITRADGNVLYELDGKPALELYKTYLGEHAAGLPATGLLFPLSIRRGDKNLVRTILAVDDDNHSLTFAGDVPVGTVAQLMKANFERLIDGAQGAATRSYEALGSTTPELALLISCVGRRLVLKQRTEEEVEGVRDVLGHGTMLAGFYSYGEICPSAPDASCELHNQTMTITTLSER
jgi:hypothetical protein